MIDHEKELEKKIDKGKNKREFEGVNLQPPWIGLSLKHHSSYPKGVVPLSIR